HWRTSARRGALHTIELDTHVQGEIMIFADLTRRSRYGTGAESTTEMAIGCATAILTQAADLRHRIGMTLVREKVELFPPGEGLSHLHLLLDRLAVVSPEGELKFWEQAERCSATLRHGARAIFIAAAATTPPLESCALIRKLTLRSIAVDVILIDEGTMTRIWRDQPPPLMDAPAEFARLQSASERSGARVLPLARGETAGNLLPRGLN
ncbi:DUF58 domain-containing protein, partial [Candidatus Sumerlaeota bacterium]|nr:DUF58 domain-containing protein [Candidatus Sumerlaeota bacterium]